MTEIKKRDNTFTILSAFAIVLILLGHLDLQTATLFGVFPYYSYHVMIFVFISGYFYKPEDESDIIKFIIRKAKRLLLPYYVWNVFYGLIAAALRTRGFSFAGEFDLYNIFIAPFMGGHQFGLNAAAWFVPALFLLQICDIIARKAVGIFIKDAYGSKAEWIFMVIYLAVGMLVVWLAIRGSVYDWYKLPGRLMLMAPPFQFGRLYRTRLKKNDVTPGLIYFPLLICMNLILIHFHGGLAYSTVWVTGFAGTVATPFITALTGTALWLRISKIISRLIDPESYEANEVNDKNDINDANDTNDTGVTKETHMRLRQSIKNVFDAIGTHTYDIMMHHLAVFMLIKAVFAALYEKGFAFADFDIESYRSDIYYTYAPGIPWLTKCIYLLFGLIIPVIIGYGIDIVKREILKRLKGTEK